MSGIVALLNRDGAPIDRGLLDSLTTYMRFRGPDRTGTWSDGPVGLGHTLLVTTDEMAHEQQPSTFDEVVWITADVRIDDQAALRRKLEAAGRRLVEPLSDADLVLHAYHVWGQACVEHLLGDFAFVIWDGRRQLIFAARDQMGIKPLFFVAQGQTVAVSNTLNCLRMHPAVSDNLNRDAIESYLATGMNAYLELTAFTDIQRLPPAHTLTISDGNIDVRLYWALPYPEPLDETRPDVIVDTFRDLLETAVADRLRTDKVAVLMSGGLDSPSIAAIAHNRKRSPDRHATEAWAFTGTYTSTLEDDEEYWAKLAADFIGINISWLSFDLPAPLSHWNDSHWNSVEPSDGLLTNLYYLKDGNVPAYSRVSMFGYGADPILFPSRTYLIALARQRAFRRLFSDVSSYYQMRRRLPSPYLRTALRRGFSDDPGLSGDGLETARTSANVSSTPTTTRQPQWLWRPEAFRNTSSDGWAALLASYDPGNTGLQMEARFPFFDLRLVNFALSLPSVPWCTQKEVLRQAMAGLLPEPTLSRLKQPLRGDPVEAMIDGAHDSGWPNLLRDVPAVGDFVDVDLAIQEAFAYNVKRDRVTYESEKVMRPYALAYWLKNLDSFRQHTPAGETI